MHVLKNISFKSGGYGCSFANGCGLGTWKTNYHRNLASLISEIRVNNPYILYKAN